MLCSPLVKRCASEKRLLEAGRGSAGPRPGLGASLGRSGEVEVEVSAHPLRARAARSPPASQAERCRGGLPARPAPAVLLPLTQVSAQGKETEIIFALPSLSAWDELNLSMLTNKNRSLLSRDKGR